MSAAAIVAPHVTSWPELQRDVKSGKYTLPQIEAAERELLEPKPAPKGSTAPKPGGPPELIPGENKIPVVGTVSKLAGEAGEAIGGVLNEGVNQVGKEAGEGIIHLVEPVAKKMALYGLFIFGGLALIVFGFEQLLKPVGGPDITGKIKSAAKGAGAVAE